MKKRNLALAFGGAVGAAVAVKLLTRAGTVNWEDVSAKVAHSENSHFTNVDGARVHYQEFGDNSKPHMILIHGFTASVYVWKTVAPMLAEAGFHVIAIDLLGFGYSEKPSWFDYSIQSQARMVSRFMNRLGIGRATIVGSSYGGAVALMLQKTPSLTPYTVKARLMKTATKTFPVSSVATDTPTGKTYVSTYDMFTIGAPTASASWVTWCGPRAKRKTIRNRVGAIVERVLHGHV